MDLVAEEAVGSSPFLLSLTFIYFYLKVSYRARSRDRKIYQLVDLAVYQLARAGLVQSLSQVALAQALGPQAGSWVESGAASPHGMLAPHGED